MNNFDPPHNTGDVSFMRKNPPRPGEISLLMKWDLTISVVLRLSYKREMKYKGFFEKMESGKSGVFAHIDKPLAPFY